MSDRKLVALDAGHGLKTAGKQTPDGIKEWTLNDKVRDKIVDMLKGYNVDFIFPDKDEGATDESLSARRGMYVNAKVDAAVSLHHNAHTSKWNNATGVEVFIDRAHTAKDKELAEYIYAKLPEYTGLKGRGIKKANFAIINQNAIPAVLVEGGFMDSTIDYPVITSDAGQTGYAKAVAEGLIEFLKLEKVKNPDGSFKPLPGVDEDDTPNGIIKPGNIVEIEKAAVYYNGDEIPNWVKNLQWIVKEVNGNRIVIDKSADGKHAICSPIHAKYLNVVNKVRPAEDFKVSISIPNLNIRKGPGTSYSTLGRFTGVGVFTIVDVKPGQGSSSGWGLLKAYEKDRNGWISLDYAKRV